MTDKTHRASPRSATLRLALTGLTLVALLLGCGAENGRDLAGVQVAPVIHCTRAQSATTVTVGDITVDCGKRPEVVPPVVVVDGEPQS